MAFYLQSSESKMKRRQFSLLCSKYSQSISQDVFVFPKYASGVQFYVYTLGHASISYISSLF